MGDVVPFRRAASDFFEELIVEMVSNPLVGVDLFQIVSDGDLLYATMQPDVAEEVLETLRRLHPGVVYEKLTVHLPAGELLTRGR